MPQYNFMPGAAMAQLPQGGLPGACMPMDPSAYGQYAMGHQWNPSAGLAPPGMMPAACMPPPMGGDQKPALLQGGLGSGGVPQLQGQPMGAMPSAQVSLLCRSPHICTVGSRQSLLQASVGLHLALVICTDMKHCDPHASRSQKA